MQWSNSDILIADWADRRQFFVAWLTETLWLNETLWSWWSVSPHNRGLHRLCGESLSVHPCVMHIISYQYFDDGGLSSTINILLPNELQCQTCDKKLKHSSSKYLIFGLLVPFLLVSAGIQSCRFWALIRNGRTGIQEIPLRAPWYWSSPVMQFVFCPRLFQCKVKFRLVNLPRSRTMAYSGESHFLSYSVN